MNDYLESAKVIISIISWPTIILVIFFTLLIKSKSLIVDENSLIGRLLTHITSVKLGGSHIVFQLQRTVKDQQEKIGEQQTKIEEQNKLIQQIVAYSLSYYNFDFLKSFYDRNYCGLQEPYYYYEHHKPILCLLQDLGYIEPLNISSLNTGRNLVNVVRLTPTGKLYVEVREKLARGERKGSHLD